MSLLRRRIFSRLDQAGRGFRTRPSLRCLVGLRRCVIACAGAGNETFFNEHNFYSLGTEAYGAFAGIFT